jgi:CRISPR-associated protein Cas1
MWPGVPREMALSCEELGITGKLDAVETDGGGWAPVEAKHSAPPEIEREILDGEGRALMRGAWSNDQIQIAAQMMLLRANDHPCERGFLYYRKTKQRVEVPLDERLEEALRSEVARATSTMAGPMPPPLIDSPKCPRCSLQSICLPDETNWLLRRTDEPPARVMPGRDDAGVLHLTEPGSYLGKKSKTLVVTRPGDEPPVKIPIKDVSHVTLVGAVQISTQALHELLFAGRSVSWITSGGRYIGAAHPPLVKNFHLRRMQFRLMEDAPRCLHLARGIVAAKILNGRTLLRRNGPKSAPVVHDLRQLLRQVRRAESIEALMGVEGTAAKLYFPAFAALLKGPAGGDFDWQGRSRRPPKDPINAMLSLVYALLTRDVEVAIRNAGLEPMAGFFHAPENGRPALALDLMEAFRPLIAESVVLRAVNSGSIEPEDFWVLPGQAALKDAARKRFFAAYQQRMAETVRHPRFRFAMSYRRTLELEARLFARHLEGELPDYIPLMTR